jgi:hypothetical protein
MIRIGVPKEIHPGERRVAATPQDGFAPSQTSVLRVALKPVQDARLIVSTALIKKPAH